MAHRDHIRRALVGATTALLMPLGLLAVTTSHAAALDAPGGMTADLGPSSLDIPVFSWSRVDAATGYRIEIDNDADFTSPLKAVDTVNDTYVPDTQLATGVTLYWRVRAKQSTTNGEWSSSTLTRAGLPAPAVSSPEEGATFSAPSNPPTFLWSAVAGATTYRVRISNTSSSECETGQVANWTGQSTKFVLSDRSLAPSGSYYWCVRAELPNSVNTEWTSPRSFQVTPLAIPHRRSPTNNEVVQQVVLDWDPVPGAVSYDLQVGTDVNFNANVVESTNIQSTRYSPALTYDNRTWYWRVRARDASGNFQQWSELAPNEYSWFVRRWPEQPKLEWPQDQADVDFGALYYQWAPVSLATKYRLQTSATASFDSFLGQCETFNTTYVGECGASQNGPTYWRVLAVENTEGVTNGSSYTHETTTEVINAEVRQFSYNLPHIQQTWPADGQVISSGTIPTLKWVPQEGAAKYRVTIRNGSGSTVTSVDTVAAEFTPRTLLAKGAYTWDVQMVTFDNHVSNPTLVDQQSAFSIADTFVPTAPGEAPSILSDGVTGYRPPTLSWTPVTGATKYLLNVKRHVDTAWGQVNGSFAYPAGQDTTDEFLSPGVYDWYVLAYADSTLLATTPTDSFGTFTILDPRGPTNTEWTAATDFHAALSGNAMFGNAGETQDRCDANTNPATCVNLRQTPVLEWDPHGVAADVAPYVSHYQLSLFYDANYVTPVPGFQNISVRSHLWMPTSTLPDAQAGQQGETGSYYWYLVPCAYDTCSSPSQPLTHAFNKMSNQATLKSPVPDAVTGALPVVTNDSGVATNDVVFEWNDFLDSQAQAPTNGTSLQNSHADTAASQYKLTWATKAAFSGANTVTVDQKVFTPTTIVPDGTIYWKVRALDGQGRPLNESEVASFTHVSPHPTGLTPAAVADVVSGRQALSWSPVPYASKYTVEVYAGGVPQGSSTTDRKVNATVFSTLYTPGTLLAPGPHTWRVRAVDASGNLLSWSDWARFTVAPDAPTLEKPAADAEIAPLDVFFAWDEVEGANGYRVEWRKVGGTASTATTSALAYALPSAITSGGDYEWRVVARRDTSDWSASAATNEPWRPFHVALGPTVKTPVGLSGAGNVGTTLTVVPPTWDMPQTATSYQWFKADNPINGETGTTYNILPGDAGYDIKVTATGTVPGYNTGTPTSASVTAAKGAPPQEVTATVIAGEPRVGLTLTVSQAPTWDLQGVQNTYTWRRGATTVGTGTSYVVQLADVGATLTVDGKGVLPGYGDGHSISNALVAITGDAATGTPPVITGLSTVGSTLTVQTAATWTRYGAPLTSGSSTKYEWLRDGAPIPAATAANYKIAAADAAHAVSLRVSLVQSGYETGVVLSSNSVGAELGPAPTNSVRPTVSGTPGLGTKLTAKAGTWSTNGTFSYQWLRDGAPIPAATSTTYTVTLTDIGHAVGVSVTNTIAGRAPGRAASAAVVVPKVVSKAALSLKSTKVKRKKKVAVTVTITASGVAGPTGTIQILAKGKVIATKILSAGQGGKLTFKVTAPRKKGKYPIVIRYLGSATVVASQSAAVRLKVT